MREINLKEWKAYVIPNLPYLFLFWLSAKAAECYRISAGTDVVTKMMGMISNLGGLISARPFPSFHLKDILYGVLGAVAVRLVVYYKAKNAKKYRNGVEYGSARCGA